MKTYLSQLENNKKIFIGDYDSYTIITEKTDYTKLINLTKAALLLFDRILLPAAFFWQSNEMNRILPLFEESIESGFILPMIRDRSVTINVQDYFSQRFEESQKIKHLKVFKRPEIASELAEGEDKQVALELNGVDSFGYIDNHSIKEKYVSNWLNDLSNHQDINSINLLLFQADLDDIQRKTIIHKLSEETSNPCFSRASCIQAVESILSDTVIRKQIVKRTSYLYLKSNADVYGSGFFLSNDLYNNMVFEDNIKLLIKTLSAFGITPAIINTLSLNDILAVKNSPEYLMFIQTYNELINKAYTAQNDIVSNIQKQIKWELRKETLKNTVFKSLKKVQNISSTIFIGLITNQLSGSPVKSELYAATGSAAAFASLAHFNKINRYFNSTPFLDFKNSFQDQFKSNISKVLVE